MNSFPKTVLAALLQEVKRTVPQPYRNAPGTVQSSVGVILREIHSGNPEVLMVQRSGYEGDRNAYNVVFPGGQCDGEQTDLQACERELQEEVSLKVRESCEYLGQLPSNFYYLRKRGKKVYITCHLWQLRENDWQPTLNQAELRAARWVPFLTLIDQTKYVTADGLRLGIVDRMGLPKWLDQSIRNNLKGIILPELEVGLERNLWGLTLWLWGFMMQMAHRNLRDSADAGLQAENLQSLRREIDHLKKLELTFVPWYWLKYPVLGAVKAWHWVYRVQPFSYQRPGEKRAKVWLCILGLVVLVCWVLLPEVDL